MSVDPSTTEGRNELRAHAEDGNAIYPSEALALLDALDTAWRIVEVSRTRAQLESVRAERAGRDLEKAEAALSRVRTALDAGANILDNNAAMLNNLVMDTPEDQDRTDRIVELTRQCAQKFRTVLGGGS